MNDDGVKMSPKIKKKVSKELTVPDYFKKELSKNKIALKTFENFSNSHQREYIEWITGAKSEETETKECYHLLNGCLKENPDIGKIQGNRFKV